MLHQTYVSILLPSAAFFLLYGAALTFCQSRNPSLLVFTSVHREQALDIWALTEYLVSTRGYEALVLVPDSMLAEFRQTGTVSHGEDSRGECLGGTLNVMAYPSVTFEEYQPHGQGPISELTGLLNFHLENCASLLLNRSSMDTLAKKEFTAMLGVAMDPCSTFLADRLKIRRRVAFDDGGATSLLWGVLLGQGHPTSHVAAYGTGIGGGRMTLPQQVRNVLQYYRLQLWRRRVYESRVAAFYARHRLTASPLLPPALGVSGDNKDSGSGGRSPGRVPCHLLGQVIITGAEWGLLEPQPLPPSVKMVGPLRARGSGKPVPPERSQETPPAPTAAAIPADAEQAEVAAERAGGGVEEEQKEAPGLTGQQQRREQGQRQEQGQGRERSAVGPPRLQPEELAAHVAAAHHGVAVICFPPDYRLPLRALLAIAEAVIDLRQHIVWRAAEKDIARVRQLYLPLKHARHILMLPEVPLGDLLAQPNVVSLVTAGSVQAIYAAIYAAKPVMAVPLNLAQEDLVARLGALGAGQRLSRAELEGGAASYRVSVAIERMSNVYSFTQSMQLLSTQLRATLGSSSSLERAAAWVDYTAALDEAGRQYLVPRSAMTVADAAGVGGSAAVAASGGTPAAGGGGGCMGTLEAANAAAYFLLAAAGLGVVALVALVVHVCTRVPPPPSPSKAAKARSNGGHSRSNGHHADSVSYRSQHGLHHREAAVKSKDD